VGMGEATVGGQHAALSAGCERHTAGVPGGVGASGEGREPEKTG